MKLIVALVNKDDENKVLDSLAKNYISATKLDAEGAFLKKRSSVFLIGAEKKDVDMIVEAIKSCCEVKHETVTTPAPQITDPGELILPESETVKTSGTIIFVLELEDLIKM